VLASGVKPWNYRFVFRGLQTTHGHCQGAPAGQFRYGAGGRRTLFWASVKHCGSSRELNKEFAGGLEEFAESGEKMAPPAWKLALTAREMKNPVQGDAGILQSKRLIEA